MKIKEKKDNKKARKEGNKERKKRERKKQRKTERQTDIQRDGDKICQRRERCQVVEFNASPVGTSAHLPPASDLPNAGHLAQHDQRQMSQGHTIRVCVHKLDVGTCRSATRKSGLNRDLGAGLLFMYVQGNACSNCPACCLPVSLCLQRSFLQIVERADCSLQAPLTSQ